MCMPPSMVRMSLAKDTTFSEYEVFHWMATSTSPVFSTGAPGSDSPDK